MARRLTGFGIAPWGALIGLFAVTCVFAWFAREDAPATRRMAIEVDCTPGACELAESLALDIWSEERGAGLPLAVVLKSTDLPRLDAARVSWRVLDPDID